MSKQKDKAIGPASRNVEIRRVRVADLIEAPWNDREHPEAQRAALDEVVQQTGWYGYPDVFVRSDNSLVLCDGHLRKDWLLAKYGPLVEVDVNVTDFTEAEARLVTASKDPLSAMALHNKNRQQELLSSLTDQARGTVEKILAGAQLNKLEPAKPAAETIFKPVLPAPPMTWVLVGLPTMRYGEIAAQVQQLGSVPDILIETVSNGATD